MAAAARPTDIGSRSGMLRVQGLDRPSEVHSQTFFRRGTYSETELNCIGTISNSGKAKG